jgi:hypothetical protein
MARGSNPATSVMLRARHPMAYTDWVNEHESHLLDAWNAMQRLVRVNIFIFDHYACPFSRFCELAYAHSTVPEAWVATGGGDVVDGSNSDDEWA